MKVCSLPEECPAPEPNYYDYDWKREEARQKEHSEQLKQWLLANGYSGKNTGEILMIGHADGYAQYMLAEGRTSCLIHLPYGDAWDSPLAHYMPKKDVLAQIARQKNIASIFERQEA